MSYVWHPQPPVIIKKTVQGSTGYFKINGTQPDNSLPPVIFLHGHPGDTGILGIGLLTTAIYRAILATGHTVYAPFTGSNWGHPTTAYPAVNGGTGLSAIDDAITAAGNPPKVHLIGVSLGGCNVLGWAWRNPNKFYGANIYAPLVDIMGVYDNHSSYLSSLEGLFGAGRSAVESGSATTDPIRNTASIQPIADRINIFAARDDTLLPWATLESFATTTGAHLRASGNVGDAGGGHLYWVAGEYFDEIYDLKWLVDHVN